MASRDCCQTSATPIRYLLHALCHVNRRPVDIVAQLRPDAILTPSETLRMLAIAPWRDRRQGNAQSQTNKIQQGDYIFVPLVSRMTLVLRKLSKIGGEEDQLVSNHSVQLRHGWRGPPGEHVDRLRPVSHGFDLARRSADTRTLDFELSRNFLYLIFIEEQISRAASFYSRRVKTSTVNFTSRVQPRLLTIRILSMCVVQLNCRAASACPLQVPAWRTAALAGRFRGLDSAVLR